MKRKSDRAHGKGSVAKQKVASLAKNAEEMKQAALGLKAISHHSRLLVLCTLLGGPRSVNELVQVTGHSQSSISQHLLRMVSARILVGSRVGNQVFYTVAKPQYRKLIKALCDIYGTKMFSVTPSAKMRGAAMGVAKKSGTLRKKSDR